MSSAIAMTTPMLIAVYIIVLRSVALLTTRVSRKDRQNTTISAYTIRMLNKKTISFFGLLGMTVGSLVPWLFGDFNSFDEWSVLGAFVGGIVGIVLGVWAGKRFGD